MKKIIIKVPKSGEKWRWAYNGSYRRNYRSINTLLTALEKSLVSVAKDDNTYVCIKDDGIYVNESYPSKNVLQQLWCTACFLEDHLSKKVFNKIQKRYLSS